jgi:hypothetical protein
LAAAFNAHKASAENELAGLAAGVAELKSLLVQVQDGLGS